MSVSKSHGFCVNQRFTKHRTYKTQCFDEKVYPTPTTTTYEPTYEWLVNNCLDWLIGHFGGVSHMTVWQLFCQSICLIYCLDCLQVLVFWYRFFALGISGVLPGSLEEAVLKYVLTHKCVSTHKCVLTHRSLGSKVNNC